MSNKALVYENLRANDKNVDNDDNKDSDRDKDRVPLRTHWCFEEVEALFELPFLELLYQAETLHRQYFEPNTLQISTLLSIKTGACPEDCGYCGQSGHHKTNLNIKKEKLMANEKILAVAKAAKEAGVNRFCMAAAWRSPPQSAMPQLIEIIQKIKALGSLEICMTLGMLTLEQAETLASAGLDFYNHNLDTSPAYYKKITSTRTYEDRLETLQHVRASGMNVCCGGIIGMGESRHDRIELLRNLASLPSHPQSIPINHLMPVKGTPLGNSEKLDPLEFIRTIAVARILMPASYIRLSAGRNSMSDEQQILCFKAGANSIFYGQKLLVTDNPTVEQDKELLKKIKIKCTL